MKKPLLFLTLACSCLAGNLSNAQSVFTTDLEIIPDTDVTEFTLDPGDSVDIGLRVINHGPDDIDTTNYILWGLNDFAGFLVVQGNEGELLPIATGDTVISKGIRFKYSEDAAFEETTPIEVCYYLKTNLDPDEFITDTNQENDTFCFTVIYTKNEHPSAMEQVKNKEIAIAVYPNPAENIVHIPLNKSRGLQMITVFTADGRVCYRKEADANNTREIVLATGEWPRGFYFVKVQSDTDTSTGKFHLQ